MSSQSIVRWLYLIFVFFIYCHSEKVTFINVEHPHVEYFNKDYFSYINLTTVRYGRSNPVYYVAVHYESVRSFDNNIFIEFFFYEFFTNVYKRSFIEFHYNWCNLLENDVFFGAAMRQGKLAKPCPHPQDDYHLYNMTINPAIIPRGFPITKGRIYCNLTDLKTKAVFAHGHIDMRISQIDKKKAKF